jgi:hypothetical protein
LALPAPPPALPNVWLGTWSRPPDRPSQVALALAVFLLVVALAPRGPRWLLGLVEVTGANDQRRTRRFLFVASFVAALLSLGYIAFYLRGGPRAPEAATLWLQGRSLSHGHLAWTAGDPTSPFRSSNLWITAPDRVAGIYPPGYAALLAAAFWLGAPMLIGPLLAAAIVLATWFLARELAAAAGEDRVWTEWTGRIAIGLSLASAGLRYHTAESLPYGAAALAVTVALAAALHARRVDAANLFGVAGLAVGFLAATQPDASIALAVVVLVAALGADKPGRAIGWGLVASLPGIALLLAANRVAVGHAFVSPLARWTAWFGAQAPMTPKAAALALAHRVRANLLDVANFEPLALIPLLLLRSGLRRRAGEATLFAAAIVLLQVIVLGPSSGEAVAPGAGASALANVLPVEHALIALALVLAFPHDADLARRSSATARVATATFALALVGFAVHASHDHERLAASGIGRPHYEPDIAREGGAVHGLLFIDDDEGFELAHDPGVSASHGLLAVRARSDDNDRLIYDLLGHPPAHRYTSKGPLAGVTAWSPGGGETWRFEAESDFPPVVAPDPRVGRVEVADVSGSCASEGHLLALTPVGGAEASTTIELPIPQGPPPHAHHSWTITPRAMQRGGVGTAHLALVTELGGPPLTGWSWTDAARVPQCLDLPSRVVEITADRAWLVLTAAGGPVALDKTSVRSR